MTATIGQKYDKIADWWNARHLESDYGVAQFERALGYAGENGGRALDVGCGSGGRFIRTLVVKGYEVTGIDASAEMVRIAEKNHPDQTFIQADITDWDTDERFDFILGWDSLFHLPYDAQEPVLRKLADMLTEGGIMIHTFGDADGPISDEWLGQTFDYSSVGINRNLEILTEAGLKIMHLELDQFPETHVYAISKRI